jgi:transcriptional regulator with XRE-family HTH domain
MADAASSEIPVGERIRFFREGQNRTRVSVAAKAGISVDYLYGIEKGMKVPSVAVLYKLAKILKVPVTALFSEPDFGEEFAAQPSTSALARAMVDYGSREGHPAPDLQALNHRLVALHDTYQNSPTRFTDTAHLLPDLIRDVGHATSAFRAAGEVQQRRRAARLAADLYLLVKFYAKWLRPSDVMLMAADRGLHYAEAADDPIRIAVAKWNLAQALSSSIEPEHALHVALTAAEELSPETKREGPDQRNALAIYGMLQLLAAICDVRLSDHWNALRRVRDEAFPIAHQLGEHNAFWTTFGPANCQAYAVSINMEAGETAEALRLADNLELASLPSRERRATHLLTLARCHEGRQDDAGTLLTLLRMEREAPEDLRYRGVARDLVRSLLHRARPTFARDVRELAGRMRLFPA